MTAGMVRAGAACAGPFATARPWAVCWLLLGLLVGAVGCDSETPVASETAANARESSVAATFVGSAECARCHAEQHAKWLDSHHDRAMEPATEATVLGDFDDARFGSFPILTRFFERDGGYWVHTEGPDGELGDFRVKYTFGVDPLQQYLIEFPSGRLQILTIAWDIRKQRWFDLYPDERIPPDDALHWTGRLQRWNTMCADCHSTNLQRGYDLGSDAYETTWSEIDVGCEACHGPSSNHVAWADSDSSPAGDRGLVVDFAARTSVQEVEACAPCHSRRHKVSDTAVVGEPFFDHYMPEPLREGLYHADGQVDGEVYVYGSFVQSRMYRQGVRCSDCHEPHGLGLRAEGNALCARCHQEKPDPRFPSLTARAYDTPLHHFHPDGSAGAECVACHMPAKNFMQIDARHDHSLRVPRPDLSAAIGTPNACNGCHADRSAEWAAETVAEWYGPERRQGFHYGAVIAAARAGYREIVPGLAALVEDEELPAIVRATALELFERYASAPEALAAIVGATRDDAPMVRAAALAGLDRIPAEQRLPIVAPLLDDPVRAVRIVAARLLAGVPSEQLDPKQRRTRARGIREFESAQQAVADTPGAHLNLGVLRTQQGDIDAAEQSYRTGIALDPDFLPAYFNLTSLYNGSGRNDDAERVLREALERFPQNGELYYSLGLLQAEVGRLDESATSIAKAADRLPGRARVRYNLALAYQHLGRSDEAEQALLAAREIDARDPAILRALAILYMQVEDWSRARMFAKELAALAPPGAPGPSQMLERIEAEASGSGAPPDPGASAQ
ncbi:MAG: tetratricopeptide repeat protein [Deltaproteobacteria bacterium]|nr:tetratricopeptide repeat protein [Deltaproteobacteria bacterium]MBW2666556.1 tetratricopeptide repeat protein [Deltaproteobacteria bacterium]